MNWWQYLLLGAGAGLIVGPIYAMLHNLFKGVMERRKIKTMINQGKFLVPIDAKDYDVGTWKNQIKVEDYKDEVEQLNTKIFTKTQ